MPAERFASGVSMSVVRIVIALLETNASKEAAPTGEASVRIQRIEEMGK
jgi:hypothetical protein